MKRLIVFLFIIFSGLAFANPPGTFQPLLLNATTPIGIPIRLNASGGALGSGTTCVLTTTSDAPVGSMIVVSQITNGGIASFSASDGTNAYTVVKKDASNGFGIIASGILTSKLNSGSTITVTTTNQISGWCTAAYVVGLSSATADQTATAAAVTVTTGTLAQANEIAFGQAVAANGGANPGSISYSTGFVAIDELDNFGGDHFSAALSYKIVTVTTAVTFTWTTSIGRTGFNSIAATFKGN